MSASPNVTRSKPRRVLMVVASPAQSPLGPVGFWASELTHPWYEFREVGYEVGIASPQGGRVELDAFSDPRHESGYSAHDLISLGFLSSPHARLLEETTPLQAVDPGDWDAVVVAGGQAPMFGFRSETRLHQLLAAFHAAEKPTALLCHGVSALLDVKRPDGGWLIEGRTLTGFSNLEEDAVDAMMGRKVMPFRIEDVARERGAHFASGGLWRAFSVRDGRLITGQQQYSGRATALSVIAALGV